MSHNINLKEIVSIQAIYVPLQFHFWFHIAFSKSNIQKSLEKKVSKDDFRRFGNTQDI